MKIGIVTYWNSTDNYGQIMQGLALQRYLRSLGHDPFIIRFHEEIPPTSIREKISKLSPLYLWQYIKYRKAINNALAFNQKHPRRFKEFKKNNIKYSEKEFWSFNDLLCADWSKIDAFICGSDQIWSPKYLPNWLSYMLAFAPMRCRKIAYACSFGKASLSIEYIHQLKKQLKTFHAIGLRERTGVSICKEAGIAQAKLVCDPTLLLKANDYLDIVNDISTKKNTAFIYLLNWEMDLPIQEINKYLKSQNIKTSYFPTRGNENLWTPFQDLSINNWVREIALSQLVITNSFHGTVFSIIFHRPFITFALQGKDAGMNDRLQTLLSAIGLENRIYTKGGKLSIEEIASLPINWQDVDDKLAILRQSGVALLDEGLNGSDKIKSKHNICFFTNKSIHHRYGGLDRVTELLADNFVRHGHHVFYLSYNKREIYDKGRQYFLPNPQKQKSRENIEAFNTFLADKNIDVLINQEANVDITLSIDLELRKHLTVLSTLHFNPNYIDDNHFSNKFGRRPGLANKVLNRIFKTPFIKNLGLKYLRNLLSRNYKKQIDWSDRLVLLSDRFKPDLLNLITGNKIDTSKITAINNPCIVSPVNTHIQEEKKNIILYVGRLDISFKRIDHILDIWKDLSSRHNDWEFVLVGDGADRKLLENKVITENIQKVTFVGVQDPTEYYKQAKFIILTSSASEGWGMVLVEAQHYGCVPVCYRSYSAISDIISDGKNGILVENNDTNNLRSRLEAAMDTPAIYHALNTECIKSVNRFNIETISQQWLRLM